MHPVLGCTNQTRMVELTITINLENKVLKVKSKSKSTVVFALEKLILGKVLDSE